jgi:hypothetical protein
MHAPSALIGLVALTAMVGSPLGAAHMDWTPWALEGTPADPGLPTTSDTEWGYGKNRVSGVYYGSMAALVDHVGSPLGGQGTSFTFGDSVVRCDMEVLSDGDSYGVAFDPSTLTFEPGDEPEIDGTPNGLANGALGSGTLFNDGGVGGVCHTHPGHYGVAAFNTAGCDYTDAYGWDVASVDVWLTTVCSYGHTTSVGDAGYYLGCAVGPGLGIDYGGLANCLSMTVNCVVNGACLSLASEFSCGPDAHGNADIQTYVSGWGSLGVPFFPYYPGPVDWCDGDQAAGAVVVWPAVFVDSLAQSAWILIPTIGVIE